MTKKETGKAERAGFTMHDSPADGRISASHVLVSHVTLIPRPVQSVNLCQQQRTPDLTISSLREVFSELSACGLEVTK